MYRIGEFSELTNLSVKTLRYYDEIGILNPSEVDVYTNYRYYSDNDLEVAKEIEAYKSMGFTLEEIKFIQENGINSEILKSKEQDIQNKMALLFDALDKLENLRTTLRLNQLARNDIKVRKLVKKN